MGVFRSIKDITKKIQSNPIIDPGASVAIREVGRRKAQGKSFTGDPIADIRKGLKAPQIPQPLPAPEPPESEASKEARRIARLNEEAIERRRRGRRSTILTSGSGLLDPGSVKRKTLLGS